jgi:hypothetical protein
LIRCALGVNHHDEFLASDTVDDGSEITLPMIIRHRGQVLRLFSTITTFGTPQDLTLEETAIDSYYPADAQTAELLRHPDLNAAAS